MAHNPYQAPAAKFNQSDLARGYRVRDMQLKLLLAWTALFLFAGFYAGWQGLRLDVARWLALSVFLLVVMLIGWGLDWCKLRYLRLNQGGWDTVTGTLINLCLLPQLMFGLVGMSAGMLLAALPVMAGLVWKIWWLNREEIRRNARCYQYRTTYSWVAQQHGQAFAGD